MYKVQNLTNRPFKFQGKTIQAYGTEDYFQITDYIGLSRLSNSGKASYVAVPNPVKVDTVDDVEKPVEVVENKTEIVVEPVVIEKEDAKPVDDDAKAESTETTEKTIEEKTDKFTANKKSRNKRKLED